MNESINEYFTLSCFGKAYGPWFFSHDTMARYPSSRGSRDISLTREQNELRSAKKVFVLRLAKKVLALGALVTVENGGE